MKSVAYSFLYLNGAMQIYQVHGNVGKRQFHLFVQQLKDQIKRFDKDLNEHARFLLIIQSALWHHMELGMMTDEWRYYAPSTDEKAALLDGSNTT